MTALYTMLAVIIISDGLLLAYMAGFNDGERHERAKHRTLDYVVCELIEMIQAKESERHSLTHADLVQMEQEARNKQENKWH